MRDVPQTETEVASRVDAAFSELQFHCAKHGGWQDCYLGYLDKEDGYGYVGPFAWSEADYQFHFAHLLRQEFGSTFGHQMVHVEMPLRLGTRSDLPEPPPGVRERRSVIDIVITNPQLPEDPREATRTFRSRPHLAFIEVKWFHKGSPHWNAMNWKRKVIEGVQPDLNRLADHRNRSRCLYAGMLLIDDTGAYLPRFDELNWHDGVVHKLAIDPAAVNDSWLLDDFE